MPDPIKDLYNSLKSTKLFLDENDFRQQLTKSPKEVFDVVSREKQTSGLFLDYDDFESTTGLKKKESSVVSPDGGGVGTSVPPSGFIELKPAKRQPAEVIKEPKVVGEDTLLARKMEREQRPVISTTGVRLPAAPKVVAEEKAAERALAPKLPIAPKEDIGELEGLSNAIDRGILQGKLADMLALGQMPKREDIKEIARINKELTQIPSTGAYQRFNTAPDLKTAAKEFVDNPFEITSQLISESLSALVRHGYSRAIAGAGTGAALGSLIPIPGISTAAGAGTGYIAGMGVAGYNLEMASSIMDSFREAGVDVTDEKSLTKAFDDPNTLQKAREFANKRAVPIAIFDMFSAGMGGKLLGKPAKTILGKVGRGAAEVGIQMGMAGAGETAAQLTAGQKINPTAILAEVIGEAGGGAPDIIVGTMIESKKNNQSIRKDAVRLDIKPEELQDMLDISEASGEITDAQANEIKKEYEDIQKVKQAVPEEFKKNADVIEALEQKKQLEAKKQGLDPVFAKKIDEQIKALDTKIDDIVAAGEVAPEAAPEVPAAPVIEEEIKTEEYAIPEPSPTGVLQPEQERIGEEGGERRRVESPVERVAAAQESKAEAAKKEIAKREKAYAKPEGKQLAVNELVNELYKFNKQYGGKFGLKTPESDRKRNQLLIEAKRLGFETKVDKYGKISVKGAKAIDKSYSNMAIDSKFVPLEKRSDKLRDFYNKIQGLSQRYGWDFQSFMPNVIIGADGKKMNNRQIANALKDLENGIPSKGANLVLNDLEAMAEKGFIEVRDGQNVRGVPIDEFFNELARIAEGDIDRVLGEEVESLPEADLVKWFEEMESEQQFESEIYEEPITPEALPEGGVEPEAKKEVPKPVRPTAAKPVREVGGGVTPTEGIPQLEEVVPPVPPTPPKAEEEAEYTPKEKEKALLNKLYKAKNIPEESRIGFEREGLRYQTKSQKEAELIANGVIDEVGIDEALKLADSFEFDGDVNSLIYAESLNRLAKMEREAKSPEKKQALAKKFAEVGIEYGIKSQYGGRFNAAINYFYQKSPLGIVLMEDMKRKQEFDKFAKNKEQSWKEAHDIIKAELDALKLELEGKKADPSIKTSEAKIMAARLKRAALKEKYKKGKGGGLTLTTGGLTKEGIEYVGELVATYIEEGIANVEVIVQRIFLDLKDVTAKNLDEKTANQVEEEVRKKYKETKGKSTLNKIRKKLEKLSKKKQDEVIRKSFNQIIESGGLDYDDFKKIIAEVTGYAELTDQEKIRLEELVTKTNAVERMAEKAREDRTEQSLKDFRKSEMEAGKAARELNQLVWNKPDILKRLTSIMQLSTLGIPALINNPIYNIWNQATLRFPVGLINDLVDRGVTLAAQATGTEYQREYNSLETQQEFFKKLGFGAKESVEQMITGLNRQDYIQKEVGGQQIQPLQAAKDWWASFTGKKKLTGAQLWDKAIQATVGVPAEAIARTLNIGDKPQRFAAEGAQAAAFAKSFGLKDLDYKLFIEFPKEEAYRVYKSKGLSDAEAAQKAEYIKDVIIKEGQRATFQQDNLVNTALSALFNTVLGRGKETGLANLIKTVTVSPYIKIPTNAYWSYYNLVNPEVALLQSFVHGGRAFYLNKEGEKNQAKLALRESRYWLAHSITGMAMKAVVIALVKAAVYNPGSDEEESKREREGKAFFEGQGTVNIDKLNAVLAGEDPTQVKNGLLIPNRWFGQWGTVGNAIARKYENMTPEQRKNEADYYDFMLGELSTDVLQEMEQGVFANTSSLLSAINSGSPNRYLTNTLNMFTNIVHPAALAQISRAQIPNYTTQKADSFLKELENAMLTRSSFIRELTGKYPPSKVSIWGEPITKQGGTVQKLFNITRVNKDMFARPIYDDAKKYNDINFFPPAVTSSLNGNQLTVDQTRTLQEFVGKARKARIAPYINDSAILEGFNVRYSDLKDSEDKKKVLNYLYEMGRRDGLEKFYNEYKDLKPKEKAEDFLKELQFDLFKTLQKYK